MNHKKVLVGAYISGAVVLIAIVMYALAISVKSSEIKKTGSGIKEKFEELEFVVVHRPHLTYFVDQKYLICFATRKPHYQDLAEFRCPDRLLREAAGGMLQEGPEEKKEKR